MRDTALKMCIATCDVYGRSESDYGRDGARYAHTRAHATNESHLFACVIHRVGRSRLHEGANHRRSHPRVHCLQHQSHRRVLHRGSLQEVEPELRIVKEAGKVMRWGEWCQRRQPESVTQPTIVIARSKPNAARREVFFILIFRVSSSFVGSKLVCVGRAEGEGHRGERECAPRGRNRRWCLRSDGRSATDYHPA